MEKLFTSIKLGNVEIKNRVILPSMCVHFCEKDGHMNDCFREYVRRRAAGGAGLLIIPGSPHGKKSPGRPALSEDAYIPDWQQLAEIVHRYGTKLFCQLHPAKAQAGRGEKIEKPSDFTKENLKELIESYAECALRCKKAGVDGVDIHGAHAHEIALFMSEFYNDRTDEYGGSIEARALFPAQIIRAIKGKCGEEFPVIFRISGTEMVKGGRTVEESGEIARVLERAGADAIHVSVGMPESGGYISATMDVEDCFNVDNAAVIKKYVNIPVIAVGRIVDVKDAVDVVEQGKADMVSMARAQLADPELVNKYLGINKDPVYRCIGCNQGCKDKKARKKITCMQNPLLGREELMDFTQFTDEQLAKKVMIAGAGVAGLEFACNLVRRGLKPEIYEKAGVPGGLVNLAAIPPHKKNMLSLIKSRVEFLSSRGVAIHYNTEVTEELLKKLKPDILAVTTGSNPFVPDIPGADGDNVLTGDELLKGGTVAGKNVIILGAGLIGCEVGDYLAEHGNHVSIVDITEAPATTLNAFRRSFMLKRMNEYDIDWMLESTISEITPGTVTVVHGDEEKELKNVDLVVIAAGRRPYNELQKVAEGIGGMKVIALGDAVVGGTALDAIYNSVEPAAHIFD
ncbi:MAG: NAD(P)/FAD-dependent oxidoreductase [Eubacteriales bacterium]|nr:NAD(P)/FAD-dependent oxidoreductase [Eubacteriales bacterium]